MIEKDIVQGNLNEIYGDYGCLDIFLKVKLLSWAGWALVLGFNETSGTEYQASIETSNIYFKSLKPKGLE